MNDDHANSTNPCVGICVSDQNDVCIGCCRTQEERSSWYIESNEWRVQVLNQLSQREADMFGENN